MIGTATVIRSNALNLPLPDSSVDLICTSPPYFGLRSYQDAGTHYTGQLGSEATPAEFLDALLAATREMVRVLKPSGSLFVNLGDKYSTYEAKNPSNRTKPAAHYSLWLRFDACSSIQKSSSVSNAREPMMKI